MWIWSDKERRRHGGRKEEMDQRDEEGPKNAVTHELQRGPRWGMLRRRGRRGGTEGGEKAAQVGAREGEVGDGWMGKHLD